MLINISYYSTSSPNTITNTTANFSIIIFITNTIITNEIVVIKLHKKD